MPTGHLPYSSKRHIVRQVRSRSSVGIQRGLAAWRPLRRSHPPRPPPVLAIFERFRRSRRSSLYSLPRMSKETFTVSPMPTLSSIAILSFAAASYSIICRNFPVRDFSHKHPLAGKAAGESLRVEKKLQRAFEFECLGHGGIGKKSASLVAQHLKVRIRLQKLRRGEADLLECRQRVSPG